MNTLHFLPSKLYLTYIVLVGAYVTTQSCIALEPAKPISKQVLQNYIQAEIDKTRGQLPAARQRYNALMNANGSVYTYKGYLDFLYKSRDYKKIIELMPSLEAQFAHDAQVQLIFAKTLEHTGHHKQAIEKFLDLNTQHPSNNEIAFIVAQIHYNNKELENALHVIDKFLNNAPRKPNNFIFYYLQAHIYAKLGKHDQARQAIQTCIELHPGFDKGWLLFGTLNEQAGNVEQAITGYKTFLDVTETPDKDVEQHLLELMLKQQAVEADKSFCVVPPSSLEQAMLLFGKKHYNRALQQVNKCLMQTPHDTQTRLLKVQIFISMHKPENALETLYAWIHEDSDNSLWFDVLHLIARTAHTYSKAIALLEQIHQQEPHAFLPLVYLADLYTRTGDYEKTLTTIQEALKHTDNALLQTKLLYHMSGIFYKQKKYTDMQETLKHCLAINNKYAPAHNLLAYYHATKDHNYVQAQKHIEKALAQSQRPEFLDTQAMIYYKQGNYPQAREFFEQAAHAAPYNVKILVHLGKLFMQEGNAQQAKRTLHEAQLHAYTQCHKDRCKKYLTQLHQKKA